jgi:DnaJ-domain-containing protein 1
MLRTSPHFWYGRLVLGVVLLLLVGSRAVAGPLAVLLGVAGFLFAIKSVAPVVRLLGREVHAHSSWARDATQTFRRASLPRRIYFLLVAVAEADGPMSQRERDLVRHFVLERFGDPIQPDELRAWESQPLDVADRTGLAARIAVGLDDSELDTLFCWCCLVAFADGRFADVEHAALQQVRAGLGIPAVRARMLFHLARAQFLHGNARRGTGGGWGGPGERGGQRARPAPVDQRARAYEVLGLPVGADPEQIRKRHRELVKRFHPDTHNHLGPVAQHEATVRFREIQRAYETLTTH